MPLPSPSFKLHIYQFWHRESLRNQRGKCYGISLNGDRENRRHTIYSNYEGFYCKEWESYTIREGLSQENWHLESQTQIFLKNLLKFMGISGTPRNLLLNF